MSHPGQRLSALIDGELGEAERDRVLAHLAGCQPCREDAIALRALKQRMTALGDAAAGTDLMHRLLAMTPAPGLPWPAGDPPAQPLRPVLLRPVPAAAAASSLVLAGLALAAFMAGGGSPPPAPTVTPAVDVFMIQHVITPGTAPSGPAPAPSPSPLSGARVP
ncbi:MAG: zf-HC2 domain-containing protein [Gemmatimonadota bacterium]